MLTGPVGRVVGSVPVIRGHRVPEGAPCLAQATTRKSQKQHYTKCEKTYELAAMGDGLAMTIEAVVDVQGELFSQSESPH